MFEHLKRLDVAGATSWMDMPELGSRARLLLAPATEDNPGYYNALLKRMGKRARSLARRGELTAEDLKMSREEDRELFPAYIIKGWEGVEDGSGGYVEFSKDNAAELCRQLPHYLMDRLRTFASMPERFVADELPDPQRIVEGNSESGSGGS